MGKGGNMENEILLQVNFLSKSFAVTKAVNQVSLKIYKGEIRAIIGENGSGKSTFTSMIACYQHPDSGDMEFEGKPYKPSNPVNANQIGVSMIVQEMGTVAGLTVAENIFLGNEQEFIRLGVRSKRKMNAKAKELLTKYDMGFVDPDNNIEHYSFEIRKMIEIVKAMYSKPKLLIIDETTTALSQKGREKLYELIKVFKKGGNSIIFVSHDFDEVMQLCDSISVFRDGQLIDTVKNSPDLKESDLKVMMVGRELSEKYYREDYGIPINDQIVLDVSNVTAQDILTNINFKLHKGEILGIGGLTESGMHELGKIICGANYADSGTIHLVSNNVIIKNIKSAIDNGMGYVSKNRDQESLIINWDILSNICISCLDQIKRGLLIFRKNEKVFSNKASKAMQVKMSSVNQFVSELSGGNRQKVALAKWISKGSDILVLDCPTRGIDILVKASIYDLLGKLKDEGKSIILISEELLELIGMCDRILIMKNGAINGEIFRSKDISESDIIQFMI